MDIPLFVFNLVSSVAMLSFGCFLSPDLSKMFYLLILNP